MSSEKRLLSGSMLLAPESAPTLGIVSGETPIDGRGQVRLTVHPARCEVQLGHEVSLLMAELDAKTIADAIQNVCVRLEHLRALNKAGKLAPTAVVDVATPRELSVRVGGKRTLVPMAVLPAASDQPVLTLSASEALVSYHDVTSALVEIRLSSVAAARCAADARGSDVSRVYRVDGDPWCAASMGGSDPKDTDLELYLIAFADVAYEVVAQKFVLTTKPRGDA